MDTGSAEKEKIPEKLAYDLCLEGENQDLGSDERLLRRGRKRKLDDCRKETWCGVGCGVAVMGLPRQGRKHRF